MVCSMTGLLIFGSLFGAGTGSSKICDIFYTFLEFSIALFIYIFSILSSFMSDLEGE